MADTGRSLLADLSWEAALEQRDAWKNLTPEELEYAYNPRLRIPDYQTHNARKRDASAQFRQRAKGLLDLRYGPSERQRLDLFRPASGLKAAVLMYIHGGSWTTLDKSDFSYIAEPYLARGIAVALISYGRCPEHSVADLVDQVRQSVRWLHDQGPSHGLDTRAIVVSGVSAGAQLGGMLLATDWARLGLPRYALAGAALISATFDMEPHRHDSKQVFLRFPNREAARQVSPLDQPPATPVPVMVAAGENESTEMIRQAIAYAAVCARAGCPTRFHLVRGAHHFTVGDALADEGSPIMQAVLGMLGVPDEVGAM